MPALRTYNLFISHVWDYRGDYYRLVKLLERATNFSWKDFSVPEHDPLDTRTARALRAGLGRHIRPVHAVLAISGVYASHSDWMQEEMDLAGGFQKPVIAIAPWGNERISSIVQNVAVAVVNWSTKSIVDAVRTHSL